MQTYDPKPVPEVPIEDMKMPDTLLTEENVRGRWPVIVLILLVVLLALIAAALYLWSTQLQTPQATVAPPPTRPSIEENNEPESTTAEAIVETQSALSPSTELDAIEADLSATLLPELETAFGSIEAELQTAQ